MILYKVKLLTLDGIVNVINKLKLSEACRLLAVDKFNKNTNKYVFIGGLCT